MSFNGRTEWGPQGPNRSALTSQEARNFDQVANRQNQFYHSLAPSDHVDYAFNHHQSRLVRVTETILPPDPSGFLSSGKATIVSVNRATAAVGGDYSKAETFEVIDIDLFNIDAAPLNAGEYIVATKEPGETAWYGTQQPPTGGLQVCLFQLTSTLTTGGTAAATVLGCSGPVSGNITVTDLVQKFKGWSGYRGIAYRWPQDTGCDWVIVELQEQAEMITAVLNETVGALGTVTGTLDVWWQGVQPPSVTLRVRLDAHIGLENGTKVIASYDENFGDYTIIEPQHEAKPHVGESCKTTSGRGVAADGYDQPVLDALADKIIANRATILRMLGNGSDEYLIQIDPAERGGSVIWSDGAAVMWKDDVKLRHSLQVGDINPLGGAGDGEPYLRLGSNALYGGEGLWTFIVGQSALDEQVWTRPLEYGQAASHVYIEATNGPVLAGQAIYRLAWTEPGADTAPHGNGGEVILSGQPAPEDAPIAEMDIPSNVAISALGTDTALRVGVPSEGSYIANITATLFHDSLGQNATAGGSIELRLPDGVTPVGSPIRWEYGRVNDSQSVNLSNTFFVNNSDGSLTGLSLQVWATNTSSAGTLDLLAGAETSTIGPMISPAGAGAAAQAFSDGTAAPLAAANNIGLRFHRGIFTGCYETALDPACGSAPYVDPEDAVFDEQIPPVQDPCSDPAP